MYLAVLKSKRYRAQKLPTGENLKVAIEWNKVPKVSPRKIFMRYPIPSRFTKKRTISLGDQAMDGNENSIRIRHCFRRSKTKVKFHLLTEFLNYFRKYSRFLT